MKKISLALSLMLFGLLALNQTSYASTPIDFYLNLTDNGSALGCSMPYGGVYAVRVYIRLNNKTICQNTFTDVTNLSTYHVFWVSDVDLGTAENTYEIVYDICRFTPPGYTYCCQGKVSNGPQYTWAQITGVVTMTDNITIN